MEKTTLGSFAFVPVTLAIAGTIAWAGSQSSQDAFGVPLFALCGALAFCINWLVFIPSFIFQTEHYFDLTGSLTFLILIACALGLHPAPDARGALLACLVGLWALRLGSFLFLRIRQDGSDGRFDAIKPSFPLFLRMWTIQGLWVFLTLSCALAAMAAVTRIPLGGVAAVGSLVWGLGFVIEVVADRQKRVFRADPAQAGRFITSGLWAWSRHPNYFGEILLWFGISLIAFPALSGFAFATLVSPVFVYVLLTRISGIPMLESRAKRRWGSEDAYRAFKARTPALWPRPPRGA
jgi:steroid 5-alpha reductase family enzyme